MKAIGFEFTQDMHEWLAQTTLDGDCCIYDSWTYGRILVSVKNGKWSQWQTIGLEN